VIAVGAVAFAAGLGSAATLRLPFAAPWAPLPADIAEPLTVTGVVPVSWRVTREGGIGFTETRTVGVPAGTELVIPVLQGWGLAYAPLGDSDLAEHQYGFGAATAFVQAVDDPVPGAGSPSQTATIGFTGALNNRRHRDTWSATLAYTLLCLRRTVAPAVEVVVPPPQPLLRVIEVQDQSARTGAVPDGREHVAARGLFFEPGTRFVPSLRGWFLGFGSFGDLASPAEPGPAAPAEHNFGRGRIMVGVGAHDPYIGEGSVAVVHLLRNRTPADPWFGASDADLLLLAPVPDPGGAPRPFLEIVGLAHRVTVAHNRPDARTVHEEAVDVEVPPGTTRVVPLVRGWLLGYGSHLLADGSAADQFWLQRDRPYGTGQVSVRAGDIDAGGPRPRAQVVVTLRLSDSGRAGPWFGRVAYTLLFLASRSG
jgi:hypothetical protein